MAEARKRAPNFTFEEEVFLINEVKEREEVILGKFSSVITTKAKQNAWREIALAMNSNFSYCQRGWEEVKKKYKNIVQSAKNKVKAAKHPPAGALLTGRVRTRAALAENGRPVIGDINVQSADSVGCPSELPDIKPLVGGQSESLSCGAVIGDITAQSADSVGCPSELPDIKPLVGGQSESLPCNPSGVPEVLAGSSGADLAQGSFQEADEELEESNANLITKTTGHAHKRRRIGTVDLNELWASYLKQATRTARAQEQWYLHKLRREGGLDDQDFE